MMDILKKLYEIAKKNSQRYDEDIEELKEHVNKIVLMSKDLGISKYREDYLITNLELYLNIGFSIGLFIIVSFT